MTATEMKIMKCEMADLDEIFRLYSFASSYQKEKKVVVWPVFERGMVVKEIMENRAWKLLIDETMACVWSLTFSDKEIWEERDNDTSIYIHRIAINPQYRGHNFVNHIVAWSKMYAAGNGKKFIRLDTLGNNEKLIEHYTKAGFDFLGIYRLKNTEGLPAHYRDHPDCCLFEIRL